MNPAVPTRRLPFSLFAFVGLLAASQPVLAAAPKADARATALVAALQAVSPDPLGGRLGPAAAAVAPAQPAAPKNARSLASYEARIDGDRRAYLAWKTSQKS